MLPSDNYQRLVLFGQIVRACLPITRHAGTTDTLTVNTGRPHISMNAKHYRLLCAHAHFVFEST